MIYISLPTDGEFDFSTEHDSAPDVWDFYQVRYAKKLNCKRKEFRYNSCSFDVHGDVDFNFGFTKIEDILIKIEHMKNITEEQKTLLKNLTKDCALLNYSLVNYSLLPSKGNLQVAKQNMGNDRLDTFIWALSLYYKGDDVLLLNNSSCTAQSVNELRSILDEFGKLEVYCNQMYGISGDIISQLIKSGSKALDSYDNMIEYYKSVIQYWIIRFNDFDHNQCRNEYYKKGGENIKFIFLKYQNELGIKFET